MTSESPFETGGARGYLRIATEEAFCPPELMERYRRALEEHTIDDPGFYSLWGFYGGSSERARLLSERIQDLDARRIADMDATGIDKQVLSLTAPGVQIFDAAEGTRNECSVCSRSMSANHTCPEIVLGAITSKIGERQNGATVESVAW